MDLINEKKLVLREAVFEFLRGFGEDCGAQWIFKHTRKMSARRRAQWVRGGYARLERAIEYWGACFPGYDFWEDCVWAVHNEFGNSASVKAALTCVKAFGVAYDAAYDAAVEEAKLIFAGMARECGWRIDIDFLNKKQDCGPVESAVISTVEGRIIHKSNVIRELMLQGFSKAEIKRAVVSGIASGVLCNCGYDRVRKA